MLDFTPSIQREKHSTHIKKRKDFELLRALINKIEMQTVFSQSSEGLSVCPPADEPSWHGPGAGMALLRPSPQDGRKHCTQDPTWYNKQYSSTRLGQTWIPWNHIFLKHILFPLPNSFLFLQSICPFVEQIQRFNIDSLNFSPLFSNKKTLVKQILRDQIEI